MENIVQARINSIMHEYAQLKHMDKFALTLEAIDDAGNVKALLKSGENSMEVIIGAEDDLSFIADTFGYSDRLTLRGKDIRTDGLRMAYYDERTGHVVFDRGGDGYPSSEERLKVSNEQKDEIFNHLKTKLGKKFKIPKIQ